MNRLLQSSAAVKSRSPKPEGIQMRFPRMTTQRWMAVTAIIAIVLWLSITAYRVKHDTQTAWIFHFWERYGSITPGSIYNSQHPAPFWPRYWRRLVGQPWPGTYACDPSTEASSKWGRSAVTVTAPLPESGRQPLRSPVARLPASHHGNRALSVYFKEYLPRHWKKDADGDWVSSYK